MNACQNPRSCDGTCGNWHPGGPCPCGCEVVSTVLSLKTGHVRGCGCRSCIGRRSQRKGRTGQRRVHHALGGEGPTPTHEESGRETTVIVRPEVKAGAQVPKTLTKLVEGDFTRRAMNQARRSASFGTGIRPAVTFVIPGGGIYMLVELEERKT